MSKEVTVYCWDINDNIEVKTVSQNKAKNDPSLKQSVNSLVNYRVSVLDNENSNNFYAIKKNILKMIEVETKLHSVSDSEGKYKMTKASNIAIENLEDAIGELTALKLQLEQM